MSAALSNIMKTAHFGVWDQMGHKLCHLFSKKHTKCKYCQHQYILLILLKRKILIWNAVFSFSSDPARSDQCFVMSLTINDSIIHSVPKSTSQAKLSLHVICQSCSMCLSWLLNVFFMPNKTKLKFDHDQASAVELKWLCIVCGFGLDINSLCGNSQSFPKVVGFSENIS